MIHCKDFDISKFNVPEVNFDDNFSKMMGFAFPKYNGKPFIFQTGYIKLRNDSNDIDNKCFNFWGVPKKNCAFYDNQKRTFNIYESKEQPSCQELFGMMKKIDHYMNKMSNAKNLFSINPDTPNLYTNLYKTFKYLNIIRTNQEGNYNNKVIRYPKCSFKYLLDTKGGYDNEVLLTKVFKRNTIDSKPVPLNIKNLDELCDTIKYGDTVRMIVRANHVWAIKKVHGGNKKDFGITFKILQLEIIPNKSMSTGYGFNINKYGFDTYDKPKKNN